MKTLTTDYIIKGYEQLELKPMRNSFFRNLDVEDKNSQKCSCGLATLYLIENPPEDFNYWWTNERRIDVVGYFESKGYDVNYLSGFMVGFDSAIDLNDSRKDYPEFIAGITDGKNVWEEANKNWEAKQCKQ